MFLKPLLLLSVSCLSLFVPLGLSSPLNHHSICKELVFTAALHPLDSPSSPSLLYVAWRGYSKEKGNRIEPDSPQLTSLPCSLSYKTSDQLVPVTRHEPKEKEARRSYPAYLLPNGVSNHTFTYKYILSIYTGSRQVHACYNYWER